MKKTSILFGGIFIFLLSFGLTYYFLSGYISEKNSKQIENSSQIEKRTEPVKINYLNIEKELSKNEVIESLPTDAKMLIRFYNFNSGQRAWEKNYSLTKGNVKEGTIENPDVILNLDSKYLNNLTTQNFCSIIKEAKEINSLSIEIPGSKTSLAWKYSAMYKYKDCFGM